MSRLRTLAQSALVIAASLIVPHVASAQVTAGAGTAGRIPLWTGPHSQGNSVIIQNANKIGIGASAPVSPLEVVNNTANPAIYGINANGYAIRGSSTSSYGLLGTSSSSIGVGGSSTSSTGVYGLHGGSTGTAPGVWGRTLSNDDQSGGVLGSATSGYGLHGISASGDAIFGESTGGFGGSFKSLNSYAAYFISNSSDAADFYGASWGIYIVNTGSQPAVDAFSSSPTSYAGRFNSSNYRAGYFKSGSNANYSLYVDSLDGPTQAVAALNVRGTIRGEGDLIIGGSKAGYVVDEMQNADNTPLEAGDVVAVAADSGAPVLGKIPVPRIRLASSAYDTSVIGVVDEMMYVPDDVTRTAYEAQTTADRDAARQAQALADSGQGKASAMAQGIDRISDEAGTLHVDSTVTSAENGRYCSVVTLGAYRAVKVDANYGPIRAGDLLTTSPHAGYAMKVSDKVAASGAIIGKALSSLPSGTGTVAVMVTLK